jgi:hypothetical protein
MQIAHQVVVFDAADLSAESSFRQALGARLLQAADGLDRGDNFQVHADPAGHPFCLRWA